MTPNDALQILGSSRVIWIDDCFNDSTEDLAKLLYASLEVTKSCAIPELAEAIAASEFDPSSVEAKFAQALGDASEQRRKEIKAEFFATEGITEHFATGEMGNSDVQKTCDLMSIKPEDRWTFEKAGRHLKKVCDGGDDSVSYIVDLNESGGSPTRGLEILKELHSLNSKGIAFILTHDVNATSEGDKEAELRAKLAEDGQESYRVPVCVIAKERLKEDPTNPNSVEAALSIGIKRAGLRRSLHEVLDLGISEASKALDAAAEMLLRISPEHLERYVYERGYKEGVSELHVVERAITAYFARQLRSFFGTNEAIRKSTMRLRGLRSIRLGTEDILPDENLTEFRTAELWESSDLINGAMAPIACGDVFELDMIEGFPKGTKKKFYLLLGQPCDIALRPGSSKRQQEVALLVPLKRKDSSAGEKPKEPALPFKLDDQNWACDLRNAANVNLAILDLASFRPDGRVRVDEGHSAPTELLIAQREVYAKRTAAANAVLNAKKSISNLVDDVKIELQLTFGSGVAFKRVQCPTYAAASEGAGDGLPNRVTWKLRRYGRLRMPYAAAMLAKYVNVLSREAFDLDYMNPGSGDES